MAEARQAVGVSFTVTHDGGIRFDFDNEVIKLIWESGKRRYKKAIARFLNNLKTGFFPFGLEVVIGSTFILTIFHLLGFDLTFGIKTALVNGFNITGFTWIMICAISALLVAFGAVKLVQLFLRCLFSYQGWIYIDRTKIRDPPLHIKIWMLMVKLMTDIRLMGLQYKPGKPMLFSYQEALPSLPVPSISNTLQRHMRSVRPILTDAEYSDMEQLSSEFETGLAPRLQRFLYMKWLWSDNFVSDWWEDYVYLMGRDPIMINSNYYAIDTLVTPQTHIQSARAANCIYSAFCFRRMLDKQEIPPLMIHGLIPLCSRQYERLFNTTRIPGIKKDTLVHLKDSTHVVVLHKGKYYRMGCYSKGRLLDPVELQAQIEGILSDDSPVDQGENLIAVMTASDRATWAQIRETYFSKGVNKVSLSAIDDAAFFVVLDDADFLHDENHPEHLNNWGKSLLHGDGTNRWFDKSFNLIVSRNARIGNNSEHSWADAPIIGHFWEYILGNDYNLGYDKDGNCCRGTGPPSNPLRASKLRWQLDEDVIKTFATSLQSAKTLISDLDLYILDFPRFGKGEMKKCNLSPDAFVQLTLQLAYFRNAAKFCLTYESSMTRLFRDGRTETVRPCTVEAAKWAIAMDNPNVSREEKVELLREASIKHQRQYQDAMTGKGVDRHLFCLYVVAKYLEVESPFLQKVLKEPWKLSTSQTAVRGDYTDLKKYPERISCGGGFGPVSDAGYGVSYLLIGEDRIFFHVSSKHSSSVTNSTLFASEIEKTLIDVRSLFLD